MKKKYELLAPAGSYEKMEYAIEFGADAVYAGLPDFSLRARINKFDQVGINEAINYIHKRKKKIYITVNIFAHNRHIGELEKYLKILKKNPPDALIASDIGVIELIRKILPDIKIHLSTQANTTNWQAVNFWRSHGVDRIILARELSLAEIAEIHKKVPNMELECFVHGAMCMSYSGRCLLSAWKVGRSANLGDCAQNCRGNYHLVEEKRPNELIPVEQDLHGTYLLNSKDLCLIEHLDELKKAGITSFKIEGRAKSVYYLSQVVKAYKSALDLNANDNKKKIKIRKLKADVSKLLNRTFTTGFLFDECKERGQEIAFSHIKEEYSFVGEVVETKNEELKMSTFGRSAVGGKNENSDDKIYNLNYNLVKIKVHNALYAGDKIEFIQPRGENLLCKIKGIYDDKNMEPLESAHGGQDKMVYIKINKIPEKFSILRKYLQVLT